MLKLAMIMDLRKYYFVHLNVEVAQQHIDALFF